MRCCWRCPAEQGFEASAALAEAAHRWLPPTHPLRALALLIHGAYLVMTGAIDEGRAVVERSRDLAQSLNLGTTWVGSATMLAALDIQTENWISAEESIQVARHVWLEHDLDDFSTTAWVSGVSGFLYARGGTERQARADLRRVEAMMSGLRPLLPWLQVLVQSIVARAWSIRGQHVSCGHGGEGGSHHSGTSCRHPRSCMSWSAGHVQAIGTVRGARPPHAGGAEAVALRAGTVDPARGRSELHLSPETVKSELRSIYRKVGVSSRRELQDLADTLVARVGRDRVPPLGTHPGCSFARLVAREVPPSGGMPGLRGTSKSRVQQLRLRRHRRPSEGFRTCL